MALPINIDDLINRRVVESARVEYKKTGMQSPSSIPFVPSPMTLTIGVAAILSLG